MVVQQQIYLCQRDFGLTKFNNKGQIIQYQCFDQPCAIEIYLGDFSNVTTLNLQLKKLNYLGITSKPR